MRTIILFWPLALLTMIWNTSSSEERRQRFWFDQLPNQSLAGVPSKLIRGEKYFKRLKEFYFIVPGSTGTENHIAQARNVQRAQKVIPPKVPFPCNVRNFRSTSRPTSVHQLRPGDIDVIAAMGDSLTAGNGGFALNVLEIVIENRGVQPYIGGQGDWRTFLTLPNILKEFNPKLIGYSLNDSLTHQNASQFNVAEIGALSQDMPFMARQLLKRIKRDPRVDFNNDWKLVSVLIGSNNFCVDICYLPDAFESVESHKEDLIKTFEFLRDNMPRTIVNLIISPNLKLLRSLKGKFLQCTFTSKLECPCLFTLQFENRIEEFSQVMDKWQQVEYEVANDERFKIKDDFTVVVQSFTEKITFPLIRNTDGEVLHDLSYLSQDCFHFSQKGYCRAANAVWNNMLEPVGNKSINWTPAFQRFLCPTKEHPYIFTWKNSKT